MPTVADPARPWPQRLRLLLALLTALALSTASHLQADQQRVTGANFKQAHKYGPEFLRPFIYSTAVVPNWIGKTDVFWYEYRTSKGRQFYRVNAQQATREPLFNNAKLATLLSEMTRKPLEPALLPLSGVSVGDDGNKMKFVTGEFRYEYDLRAEQLVKLGKAPVGPPVFGGSPEQLERLRQQLGDERFKQLMERQRELQKEDDEKKDKSDIKPPPKGLKGDYRAFSPDRKVYAFAREHNLFLAEAGKEGEAIQLTKDGAVDYSFGAASGGVGGKGKGKGGTRPFVSWSKDSKAFHVTRTDARGVEELFLVNPVAQPRPTLSKYKYPMPGEENIRRTELHVYHKATNKLVRVEPKWKDEAYTDIHWGKSSDELRFTRRDRLHRNAEFCSYNVPTGECRCLITDGFENANIVTQPIRYLDESDEMIWWSERSGWAHFYLYERGGKLKNAITSGPFRASRIVAVDAKNRLLFFHGNHREEGENAYLEHLYCVRFDGTGLTLMDPGNGHHQSFLSPSKQFVVDTCSRLDLAPVSVVRDHRGKKIMDLERSDLSRLFEVGWQMPETFVVKAADGVTDLYGNMWKPFDFDPKKKYPIIAHVYPGPQTESMPHAFTPVGQEQQLAQLGFIVIQVGHRGGSPLRSKLYGSYGYGNLRDYALADKKTAIEQLAARHPFIDIDRVGIYGHSGGGFLSAAAMLQKPYNDFFKAAVASAGNHDNNIYNNAWAERYHGMKEVPVGKDDKKDDKGTSTKGKKFKGKGPDELDDDKKDTKTEVKKDQVKEEKAKEEKAKEEKAKPATRFEIKVPTNAELAANLKGRLLLVHGDMDNNVHPANTMRLVDALIKANKRFDLLILPGKAHGFGDFSPYFRQRTWEFFAEHLLDDRPRGADMYDRRMKD
ncbi:MAG TPA: DPP IV N-terminal domain-containing protein [Gemmataceae bacterium]|nr:DPP IV N-terminal domain-containing protein [Gemmataceae bacterium]